MYGYFKTASRQQLVRITLKSFKALASVPTLSLPGENINVIDSSSGVVAEFDPFSTKVDCKNRTVSVNYLL